jgi:hypothetical protein
MDARLDPQNMPDFQKVMHVIRNAEEGASDDAIRSYSL